MIHAPSSHSEFSVRPMTLQDVRWALDLARHEGWNPGLEDAAAFFAADNHGFFIGTYRGEPVSCISAVAYGQTFGFLGLYIVREGFRGRGFGIQTWRKGMHYLGHRCVGLDGVVAQQENYRKSGFKLAYRNVRFEGVVPTRVESDHANVMDLKNMPLHVVEAYDVSHFGAARRDFLSQWFKHAHAAKVIVSDSGLHGYAVLRRCHQGFKFGPLFADDEASAERLFAAVCATIPGETFYLDIPEANAAAMKLAQRHGLRPVFETARMYTGTPPQVPLQQVFGVTTFELG